MGLRSHFFLYSHLLEFHISKPFPLKTLFLRDLLYFDPCSSFTALEEHFEPFIVWVYGLLRPLIWFVGLSGNKNYYIFVMFYFL